MSTYIVHVVISFEKQITRLYPSVTEIISKRLNDLCDLYGGRSAGAFRYEFLSELSDTARKTADFSKDVFGFLTEQRRKIMGFTVLIALVPEEQNDPTRIEPLILTISEEERLCIQAEIEEDFSPYFKGESDGKLFMVTEVKNPGLNTQEKLEKILVRSSRRSRVEKALKAMAMVEHERRILVLRGGWGSGKRATLNAVMQSLHPDEHSLTIPFSNSPEDPVEPFVRTLRHIGQMGWAEHFTDYMEKDEKKWWVREGQNLLDWVMTSGMKQDFRDHGPVDIVQVISMCIWTNLRKHKARNKLTYIIADGWPDESDSLTWLRLLLVDFLDSRWFRLIIIHDSEDFKASLAIPGKGHEVRFTAILNSEMNSLLRDFNSNLRVSNEDLELACRECGSNLYSLFYRFMSWENPGKNQNRQSEGDSDKKSTKIPSENSGEPSTKKSNHILKQLNEQTQLLFFLADISSGLSSRKMLVSTSGLSSEEHFRQGARLNRLLSMGLIREDIDGRIQSICKNYFHATEVRDYWAEEAREYGDCIFTAYKNGENINLIRLFRYLEKWGPVDKALSCLDIIFEHLLTQRRLRAVGLLLEEPLMVESELGGTDLEALQRVLGVARLRYSLLSSGVSRTRTLVREGSITLFTGHGSFAEKVALQNSRFYYAAGQLDDALKAAKDALSIFQKFSKHEEQTYSHLEMAMSLLAMGKTRDAQEHFGISRRVGSQIQASWGGLRASAMAAVTFYINGNVSRAYRECIEIRKIANDYGRRDIWFLVTLLFMRIEWELTHHRTVIRLASEAMELADFYHLKKIFKVFTIWKGRAMLTQGDIKGGNMLVKMSDSREACAFLAEATYFRGDLETARRYTRKALKLPSVSPELHGESDDWSNGFFPIEGRLFGTGTFFDFLGEWLEGFDAYLASLVGKVGQLDRLTALIDKEKKRRILAGVYHYPYWAACIEGRREEKAYFISHSFNGLQRRASQFDDNLTKRTWLDKNPWNRLIMEESRRLKFY